MKQTLEEAAHSYAESRSSGSAYPAFYQGFIAGAEWKHGKPRKDLFVCGELVEVTHWMKVPSFEDILEANRDVLERIKNKGD